MRIPILILTLVCLSPISVYAKVNVELEHADYPLDFQDETDIKDSITFIYDYFDRVYDFSSEFPIRAKLFGKHDDFARALRGSPAAHQAAGLYVPALQRIFVDAQYPKPAVLGVLYHEACHAIFHQGLSDRITPWINEGMAEYFETLRVTPSREVLISPQPHRLAQLRLMREQNTLMPLAQYLNLPRNEWEKLGNSGDQQARSIGWGLVFFLMGKDREGYMMKDFLQDLKYKGDGGTQMISSLEKTYRAPLVQIEKDWQDFISKEPSPHTFPLPSRKVTLNR